MTPATIAWLLHSLPLPETPPGGVSREALLAYKQDLEERLIRIARGA